MENPFDSRIQSVGELTRSIRGLLETSFPVVTVTGEISNLRRPMSGHLYFTLKDSEAQIRAMLFKPQQRYLARTPTDGLEVVCRGRVSVYEARGEYQLIVDMLDSKGAGLLQLAFEQLKRRLAEEGLFDEGRKRPLPFLPELITLITSPQGAAVHDFLRQARQRCPATQVEILPARVQGEGAAGEIAAAIAAINQRGKTEVIVLCRGGGSLEDLWAFNEEVLARAIATSAIPVVSAVGHETDFTIADFVADLRAPTPTAAAQLILPEQAALLARLAELQGRLGRAMERRLREQRLRVENCRRLLRDPSVMLANYALRLDHAETELAHAALARLRQARQKVDECATILRRHDPGREIARQRAALREHTLRLAFLIRQRLSRQRHQLGQLAGVLDAVSPLAVLQRGYAIAKRADGSILRSAAQAKPGDRLALVLHDGELKCQVNAIHPAPDQGGRPDRKSAPPESPPPGE